MATPLTLLPYYGALTDAEREMVARRAVTEDFPRGALLHGVCDGGGSCLGMVCVLSGELRACMVSEEGREITLFRLGEGESCVLSANCVLSHIDFETSLMALKDSRVLIVPADAYARLMQENIRVRCWTYETAAERFSQVMWAMQQLLFTRFDRRLAACLIRLYDEGGSAELRVTHEELAAEANSAREVVSRMLRRFAADGLIENRRGVIIIKDIEGLRAL